jgi:O-antigen biosynthesis protein
VQLVESSRTGSAAARALDSRLHRAGDVYDEAYYRSGCGPVPYERTDFWLRFFAGIAEEIARSLKPRTVFDAGCAKGFLVEALWGRGIEACGVDISSYAISTVRKDMQPFCRVGSLTDPIGGPFDLITCIEVLEHMPADEARIAIRNMTSATDAILFSSNPNDFDEPTHVNVRPVISWLRLFAEFNFQPDVLFDAGFLAPHAMLLRRRDEPLPDEVLVLFSELILHKLTLGDRHRHIEHLEAELARERVQREEQHRIEIQSVTAAFSERVERATAESQRQAVRLRAVQTKLDDLSGQMQELLYSRIWRTLRTGGGMLLAIPGMFTRKPSPKNGIPSSGGSDLFRLNPADDSELHLAHCDDPGPDAKPVTGKAMVRGWAAARSGIERVEIIIGDRSPIAAEIGLLRPDIANHLPDVPEAKHSGFYLEIDTSELPTGNHLVKIKTVSKAGTVRQMETFLLVNHEAPYTTDYDQWIAEFEHRDERLIAFDARSLRTRPLISILMPVFQTPPAVLQRTIDTVLAQSYSQWELCVADDHSQNPEIERILRSAAQRDSRIKVAFRAANAGIAAASNTALDLASGEFAALLDHDDELAPDALYWTVKAINREPEADVIYSDEDKIDAVGRRFDPFFKPDWSPDLLLSENYIAHFLVARRALVKEAGGFRAGFDGSQDYDLILRLTEKTQNIVHVPRVLYHWRAIHTSAASTPEVKSYAIDAAQRALRDHLDRRSIEGRVVPGLFTGRWRVRYENRLEPPASIVIASGGKVEALAPNLKALLRDTEYQNYEVLVIDNSKRTEIERLVKDFGAKSRRPIRYIDWRNEPFNYATINNEAVRHCDSPLLVFLNDDTEVISGDWLNALAELAMRPEVGCAGAKLLYPDGRIQHAGVVMGLYDNCGHAFKGLHGDRQHYFDFPDVIRNVSAVTGACLATRAEVFREVGGFDEEKFPVAFNDVDLCLKMRQKGYRVLYTPHAVLYHHEAFSKTGKDLVPHPLEVEAIRSKWKAVIEADPFYNPNLTHSSEDYAPRRRD